MNTSRPQISIRTGHSTQRGAALFVVVLVITLLTAIGLFSVRAASLVDVAAGYNRQALQTQYVTEYATNTVIAELGSGTGPAYVEQMSQGKDVCTSTSKSLAPGKLVPCFQFLLADLQPGVEAANFFEPTIETPFAPGSLGVTDLDASFLVEMTEPASAGGAVPGQNAGGTDTTFQSIRVTLTSVGQIRPGDFGLECTEEGARSTGTQSMRAHVIVSGVPR